MAKKISKKSRIPRNVRLSELIAWAESLGCAVEMRLIPRNAELPLEQKTDTPATCHTPLPSNYHGHKARCEECGEWMSLP